MQKYQLKRKVNIDSLGDSSASISIASSDGSNLTFSEEKSLINSEDACFILEKYPGKVCCFCNLGERSALGQGDIIRLQISGSSVEDTDRFENDRDESNILDENQKVTDCPLSTSRKSKSKCKTLHNTDWFNELERVGYTEQLTLREVQNNHSIFVHRMCVMWSLGISRDVKLSDVKQNIENIVAESLKRKCSYCDQYGASISCRMSCTKYFHLPCAAASGCFLIIESLTAFCNIHLNQVPLINTSTNIECRQCCVLGDISNLIMCSTCGDHYHTSCIGLVNQPGTKSGWNCTQCSKCQICKQSEFTEGRSVKCEQCQKLYHATCLRPSLSSIPKYGWKCNRCRICSDCGSRTPGAGTSSRWHCHYTICDSCYQQRNKGFSCPICHKAYRAASHKEMVKCSLCSRFVHNTCDSEADLSAYHKVKEADPDYDYICPHCKVMSYNNEMQSLCVMPPLLSHSISETMIKNGDTELSGKEEFTTEAKLTESFRFSKKRLGFKDSHRSRNGKSFFQKPGSSAQYARKRNARGKSRHILFLNNLNINDNNGPNNIDDEIAMERKLILCSAKDNFILSQDICVMCGSIGIDQEGCLLACAQCGQCYHTYCVNIKISKVILQMGWRCLDCTVCEGCGQKNDESRLILCDECDISYHIYCMDPPLDTVPHGNWKCKWCAYCQKCGRNSPGLNSFCENESAECEPCASQTTCYICLQQYNDNDLIIQCDNCKRWLHCKCDSINSEDDLPPFDNNEYNCVKCRPAETSLNILQTKSNTELVKSTDQTSCNYKSSCLLGSEKEVSIIPVRDNELIDCNNATHWVDGVYVSNRGLNIIKSLTSEIKKKRKTRPIADIHTKKDCGIIAVIESVVAASTLNKSAKENDGTQTQKKKSDDFKDGMVWLDPNNSPPEGFSVITNEEGINILRKKRQRNLQKLGIGGFNVRNRAIKRKNKAFNTNSILENLTVSDLEQKKKIVRKKSKNKLIDGYPIYLQEAFFGKTLLDVNSQKLSICDSDSSVETDRKNESLIVEKTQLKWKKKNVNEQHEKVSKEVRIEKLAKTTDGKNNVFNTKSSSITHIFDGELETSKKVQESQNEEIKLTTLVKTKISYELAADYSSLPPSPKGPQVNIHNMDISSPNQRNRSPSSELASDCKKSQICSSPQQLQNVLQWSPISSKKVHPVIKPEPATIKDNIEGVANDNGETQVQQLNKIMQQPEQPHTAKDYTSNTYLVSVKNGDYVEPVGAGTQKTAEKMRRDEDLGEMATISAVLYANSQHPELKQICPNWNDRCKQILKKWRSLSTEKKAPFLQLAKDNRSALRMRRAQQDQEKICFQQKVLKEQEQERIWKQYQVKNKDTQSTAINNDGNINFSPDGFAQNTKCSAKMFANAALESSSAGLRDNAVYTPASKSQLNKLTEFKEKIDNSHMNVDTGSKYLRTLLQKQELTTTSLLSKNMFQLGESHKSNSKAFVGSEFEKLDQEENVGFGDILGGLGEGDDDDLIKSLTTEIGDAFNILEYADPELDELTTNQNLLIKLDFDENEKPI